MKLPSTLIAILIVYGSLFPFDFVQHHPSLNDIASLLIDRPGAHSLLDIVGNLVLFLPLGMVIQFSSSALRQRWIIGGIVLAWGIQYVQFWFPSRVPSGVDALLNMVGLAAGLALGWGLANFANRRSGFVTDAPRLWPLATALMCLWLAYRWYPLVPTADWQNIKNGLKPLLFGFDWDVAGVVKNLAAWLVFFRLARISLLYRLRWPGLGFLAVAVTSLEPLFFKNALYWPNLMGLALALLLYPLFVRGKTGLWMSTALLSLSIAVSGVGPLDAERHSELSWLPFSGLLEGSMYLNAAALIEKMFLYGSLIFLLGYSGLALTSASLLVGLMLLAIEWVQQWAPGRTTEITDPLLALLLGFLIARGLKEIRHRTQQDSQPNP